VNIFFTCNQAMYKVLLLLPSLWSHTDAFLLKSARNLLSYVFPTALIIAAVGMLLLKGLKEQGRLGRSFGKVTIRDQPPSNTIQKIMALKNAMRDVESYLQNLNVTLLKIRAIILSGQPQVCDGSLDCMKL